MTNWLFKTEPTDYSFADLQHDGHTVWDGVGNNWALQHLRQIRSGDRLLIYHTGRDKAVMGEAVVVSEPYPDPAVGDPRRVVVDIEPVRAWAQPVPLSAIKNDPRFAEFALVRFSRLSVMPVPGALWTRLEKMGR